MGDTYYTVLNVSTNATQRDIKKAYRKLVQAHHPDVTNNVDDEKIKIINIAYETLSNANKKSIYDRSLRSNFQSEIKSTYNNPRNSFRSQYRSPGSYQNRQSSGNYSFSMKTQIIGWSATILVIMLVVMGIWGMHYYTSEYYFEEGLTAENEQNPEKALQFYQLAIRDWGGKNVEASIRSAELSRQLGAFYFMIDFCEKGLAHEPDTVESAKLYYLKAWAYYRTKRFIKAEKAYLNSLLFHYNKDTVYQQLGSIYINQLAKYSEAEKMYTYLLSGNSINLNNYYNRAICYQYLGKHKNAIEDLLLVLEDDPYRGTTLFQLGRSYLALGQTAEACYYLRFSKRQGINIDPNDMSKACNES